jgi:hypothetical protein
MAQFSSARDFLGSYQGFYDGRNALIRIVEEGLGNQPLSFAVEFTDTDRNETYIGSARPHQNDINAHALDAFDLTTFGGQNVIHWSKLLLHTWNTSYVSGVSVWNNTEYGMSFTRV